MSVQHFNIPWHGISAAYLLIAQGVTRCKDPGVAHQSVLSYVSNTVLMERILV